jgi:hypothetical protein
VRRAIAIGQQTGERELQVGAHNDFGNVLREAHHPDEARREYSTALALAEEIGDRYEQARALDGLASLACTATGPIPPAARARWE